MMDATTLPPALIERRSREREVFLLVNALRRRAQGGQPTGSGALLSMRIGRGDVFKDSSGNELIIDQFEMPIAVGSFGVTFAGRGSSVSGSAIFRVRLGGTDGLATDGVVIAEIVAASPSIQRIATTPAVVTNTAFATLIKITGQSTAGHQAQFRNGTLALN
jgi:hypothetical protein